MHAQQQLQHLRKHAYINALIQNTPKTERCDAMHWASTAARKYKLEQDGRPCIQHIVLHSRAKAGAKLFAREG